MLYLHETIDIIADGQQSYLDTVAKEWAPRSERRGVSRLVGTWKVVGSTDRWPRVVNLWEMDGWEQFAESLERQHLPEKRDPDLATWWRKATQWRSGGFDRILEPASYSPTRGDLEARKLVAWVCVQVVVRLRPGTRRGYLEALGSVLRPALEDRGITLMGAYAVPMRSDEALILWAAPDFRTLCRVYAARSTDGALRAWNARVTALRRDTEMLWLVPATDCFFHPLHGKTS